MLKSLQTKWKVSTGRLILILVTFATGGSLTGYAGKRWMKLIAVEDPVLYIPIYIVTITFLWPFMVLLVSIPLGQFHFFKSYISRLGRRMVERKKKQTAEKQSTNPAPVNARKGTDR